MANRFTYRPVPGALNKIVATDPRTAALCRRAAHEVVAAAKVVFNVQQRHDNENRTSEYTPPKYINSFGVRRVPALSAGGFAYWAYNDDPGWALVEYGAHPGGNPDVFVLRYRPLARGLDIVAARNVG